MSENNLNSSSSWDLRMSEFALCTENPLRKISEDLKVVANPNKPLITLQIGDPTVFHNFCAASESVEAIKEALDKDHFSYTVSSGLSDSRQAVAEYVNQNNETTLNNLHNLPKVGGEDVILTSGCSMAIEICCRAVANPGENILIPRPAWNYGTWICGSGIEVRHYDLDPSKDWEVDLNHLKSLINEKTRAILVNNPSNPCGSVWDKDHILKILKIAEHHRLPIISDEVYEFFTFPGVKYYSFTSLSKNVPILLCSGLTKRFIMPGIRLGWIVIHDRNNQFREIRKGVMNIAGRNFMPNSTVQLALPSIIKNTPKEFFDDNSRQVYNHALSAFKILKTSPGLNPIMPRGTMYLMVKIELEKFPKFNTCLEFSNQLMREQSVATFSGSPCFNFPGFFRIVLTVPENLIIEACERIKEFCEIHCKYDSEKYLKSG